MPAYIIGKLIVENWDWYREYRSVTEPLVAQYGGVYLIKGGDGEKLEGDEPLGHATVLIAFPDREAAQGWYRDIAYSRMIQLRHDHGVITQLTLVEGIPSAV
jgi:uncharacterized protein (DUF1330 family)